MLFVGVLVASVLATFLQVNSRSSAVEVNKVKVKTVKVNEVEVSQKSPEAVLHTDDKTCIIRTRTSLLGGTDRVTGMVKSVSKSARKAGMTVDALARKPTSTTTEVELVLSKQFDLAKEGATPAHCSTKNTIDAYRGRTPGEVPGWARGMVAAAAATAAYPAVVFSVTELFGFLAQEFKIHGVYDGEIVGSCIGGFASTYVANLVNRVDQDPNTVTIAARCIIGSLLNLVATLVNVNIGEINIGSMKQMMVSKTKAWLRSDAQGVVAAASPIDISRETSLSSAFSRLADAIPASF